MSFVEVCIYQVKPQKVEEFETLMLEAKELLEQQPGLCRCASSNVDIVSTWSRFAMACRPSNSHVS